MSTGAFGFTDGGGVEDGCHVGEKIEMVEVNFQACTIVASDNKRTRSHGIYQIGNGLIFRVDAASQACANIDFVLYLGRCSDVELDFKTRSAFKLTSQLSILISPDDDEFSADIETRRNQAARNPEKRWTKELDHALYGRRRRTGTRNTVTTIV